ncbi:cell division protein FtsL [bacterium]|nr:cell division protein FtsL [bacterium]
MKEYPIVKNKKSQSLIRKKTVAAKKSSFKLAITWIIMILVALAFVQQRISFIRIEKQVTELIREKDRMQLSILPLKLEERYLTQYDRIEKIAEEKLNLQIPRKVQTISIIVNDKKQED